jgi:hypothetical protein
MPTAWDGSVGTARWWPSRDVVGTASRVGLAEARGSGLDAGTAGRLGPAEARGSRLDAGGSLNT